MQNVTEFDPCARYITFQIYVKSKNGRQYKFDALLDTGAPATEFSDEALQFAGFLDEKNENVSLKPGLQTQKYGKMKLNEIEICGHTIENLEVYVSHFDKTWGIKALVGLDFFRKFRVTIDYEKGHLITEQL